MIFMTSNVINRKNVGFTENYTDNLNEVFTKEFLGRFTDLVTYQELTEETLKEYVLEHLKNPKITFETLKQEAKCELYGLRNLKHIIEKYNSEIDIEIPL